jgi:hypothetical protein
MILHTLLKWRKRAQVSISFGVVGRCADRVTAMVALLMVLELSIRGNGRACCSYNLIQNRT